MHLKSVLMGVQLDDEFLLLACDGVWDVMSAADVVVFVHNQLRAGRASFSL